jgi:ATP-dependent DNA helicase RecG
MHARHMVRKSRNISSMPEILWSSSKPSKVPHVTMDVSKDVSIEKRNLHLIRDNKDITTTEMTECLAVTRRTIQRVLDTLNNKGVVERKGGRRYGYWEVID